MGSVKRAAAAIVALAPVAAAAPTLHPGLWRVASTPQTATLDGRKLDDLPYTPAAPEAVCLSPAQAADPATWFVRDTPAGCTFSRRSVQHGAVDIVGTCPSASPGYPAGSVRFNGRWSANRYTIRFATTDIGENGQMGFAGTATGGRIGECPG